MTANRTRRRSGYTLMELIVVMAILVCLGALLAPTFSSVNRDTSVKAGADIVRARMEEARGSAIGDARPYRFSVSADGKRVRVSPEGFEEGMIQPTNEGDNPPFFVEDVLPKDVTVVSVSGDQTATADGDPWVRVATFLPDGTCKEDHTILEVREAGVHPMVVTLRGLTGTVNVAPGKAGANP